MIHWGWVILIAVMSGSAGFMLCSLIVIAKQSDEQIAEFENTQIPHDSVYLKSGTYLLQAGESGLSLHAYKGE